MNPNTNRATYEPILKTAADDLASAAATCHQALRNLEDQRRGLPGSGFGGGGGAGGSRSPVERALGLDNSDDNLDDVDLDELTFEISRDEAQAKLDEYATLIPQIQYMAQRLRTLTVGNSPRAASDRERAQVANKNEVPVLCEHCTRHRPPGKVERLHVVGDVGGILKGSPLGLCRWCYDFTRDILRLPSKAEISRHNDGLKRTAKPHAGSAR